MQLKIDLHNHSCLSPCGSDQLLPSVLAYEAFEKGVDILALTDHNSGRNLVAFSEACEIVGITGVYGIEVTTQEEVHLLALFETPEEGVDFSNWIESLLPKWPNVPQKLGHQLVCDVKGNITEEIDLFLYGPADISFDNLVEIILKRGGLAIPAHIDRLANSVLANLGFLPPLPYSAVEVVKLPPTQQSGAYSVIRSSDTHYLDDVASRTSLIETSSNNFEGLKEALKNNLITL